MSQIRVTMEVGNDGVAVITISNPPVNALAIPSKALLSQPLSLYFHFSFSSSYMIDIFFNYKEKFDKATRRSNVKAIVLTDQFLVFHQIYFFYDYLTLNFYYKVWHVYSWDFVIKFF